MTVHVVICRDPDEAVILGVFTARDLAAAHIAMRSREKWLNPATARSMKEAVRRREVESWRNAEIVECEVVGA